MASLENLTVKVSVESVLQKELIKVLQDISDDHNLQITDISFSWATSVGGKSLVLGCETRSKYSAMR